MNHWMDLESSWTQWSVTAGKQNTDLCKKLFLSSDSAMKGSGGYALFEC